MPPENLWERVPPIRYRASIPTSWVRLTLTEGKNRQVRHMTAAVREGIQQSVLLTGKLIELGAKNGKNAVPEIDTNN